MKSLLSLNKYLYKYRWRFIAGFLLIVASNLVSVYSLNYIRDGINQVEQLLLDYQTGDTSNLSALKAGLLRSAGLYIGFAILAGLLSIGTRQMIIVASRFIEFDLKNEIYSHYQNLSFSFFKTNRTGDLMNRITEDVSHVRMYLGPGIMYPLNMVALICILLFQMISIDPVLTLYTLAPLPVLSVLIYKVAITINRKSTLVQEQQSDISSAVQDSFSGIRVLKSFNAEETTKRAYALKAGEYKSRAISLAQTQAFFFPLMVLIVGLSNLLILYMGGIRYAEGKIDIGVVGLFFMYLNKLIWPFTALGWVTMVVQRAEASMKRIKEFLDVKPEIENKVQISTPIKGAIEFTNVNYRYPNTGILALKDVSFTIQEGESLAIMGRTGSGKSTLGLLLARLIEPDSGEIRIGGKLLNELNLEDLRKAIGYVPQDAFLFSETVRENLLFGVDDKSLPLAERYAKKAAVHDNIINFKEGYETKVGERGITLSGGQKQRISIARALVKQPPILIFDDSLSAVDTKTEEEIIQNIEREKMGKTSIIITHRVSSAAGADKIIVMEKGEIAEWGTHKELLKKNGLYAFLHSKQLSENKLAAF